MEQSSERTRHASMLLNRQTLSGFDPKATRKRRAKNRVAAASRRKNRGKR
jgi:hypothetical protein